MKYLIILCCATLLSGSCKKYLDKKSSTGITVPQTIEDLQALLDASGTMNRQTTPSIGEASADDYFITNEAFNAAGTWFQDTYRWVPNDDDPFPSDWSYAYRPVYNANYTLEAIEKVATDPLNKAAWNNVKGSALFFRAYYFLQLAWIYSKAYDPATASSDLGIALRLTSDFNTPSTRASVEQTYQQIIKDASASVALLPDLPFHSFRPSKAAAYGLLARTYLSIGKYDSAAKYADMCLAIKSDLMNYNSDPEINGNATGTTSPFKLFNKEIIFYTEASLTGSALVGTTNARIDTILYQSYSNGDQRRKLYFANAPGGYKRFRGNYTVNARMFSGIATDEMYLTSAECHARTGNIPLALEKLNHLLSKRMDAGFIPYQLENQQEGIALILAERRKELLMRALRFSDVKRLNKEGANIVLQRTINGTLVSIPPNDSRFALPIPREVIQQSGMPQNPYN